MSPPSEPHRAVAPLPQRRGTAAALGPLLVLLLPWLRGPEHPAGWAEPVGLLLCLLLTGGALVSAARPLVGLLLSAGAGLGFATAALPALLEDPGATLGVVLAWGLGLAWAFDLIEPPGVTRGRPRGGRLDLARGACVGALAVWGAAVPMQLARTPLGWVATALALLGASGVALSWAASERRGRARPWNVLAWLGAAALLASVPLFLTGHPAAALSALTVPVATGLVVTWLARRPPSTWEGGAWWETFLEDPARLLVATFFLTGSVGGLVLALPACSADGQGVPLVDAFFTSFSACCVTGLTTLDTAKAWSGLGQVVILLLIQVGGLGIMTFSTAALVFLGRRLSLRQEGAVLATLNQEDRSRLRGALFLTVGVTLAIELAGALVLAGCFATGADDLPMAAWRGLFHAISAYCNAGFGLQTDNLVPYQTQPLVLHTVALLIILGGLGPVLILELRRLVRGERVSLQAKLALVTTLALLVVPAVLFLLVEATASMAHLGWWDRIHNAWFFSVTPRTAGFNSVDMAAIAGPTLTLTLVLMFVGGCPGSTAGGIKTTTLALLVLAVLGALRGRSDAQAFGFKVAQASIYKAVASTALGIGAVLAGLLALTLTQAMPFHLALFETISALGTVGLTIGATPLLDSVGKVIVTACMFAGRVGPLTLFLLLAERQGAETWSRPEQSVVVG